MCQYTDKFKGVKCTTSNLDEDRIKETYPKALAIILSNKDELIAMLTPNVIVIIDKYINHKKNTEAASLIGLSRGIFLD